MERARLHELLRFAVGTSAALVLAEAMGWYPSFLPVLLAGMLLANVPGALPAKAGIALIVVQTVGAYGAFVLAEWLHDTPPVLFGMIGLVIFICFVGLTHGKSFLPILLVLLAFATVPVVTMVVPQQAGALPLAFARAMAVALAVVWVAHALWPATSPKPQPEPRLQFAAPVRIAVAGTAIVLPLILIYLLYGITDALPLLITTIVLVINFNPRRGAIQGAAMMIGNFIGGLTAIIALALLRLAPSLTTLGLITFLVATPFAVRIERGGPGGAVGLVTFNQAIVMFSLALAPGGADTGLWLTRLSLFGAAGLFAVGMMALVIPGQAQAHAANAPA